jgi:AcrR family transcriptional regulator
MDYTVTDQLIEPTSAARRRRGLELEQAIYDATWDLLAGGDHELTMAAIAERAGTSKPVLYRRWANRAELVLAAVQNKTPAPELPDDDHGTLRADLIALLHAAAAWFTGMPPEVLRSLRAATAVDPELRGLLPARITLVDIRPVMLQALERAAQRGQTSGEPVSERVLRLPLDLMYLESMNRIPVLDPEKVIAGIVDEIMMPILTAGAPNARS